LILAGTKILTEVAAEFCSVEGLGKPPAKIVVYDWEQYTRETGHTEKPAAFNPIKDEIAFAPDIQAALPLILHEIKHHLQAQEEGPEAFDRRYDEYLESHGYENNPYEVEAREFAREWWPRFESLLKEKLERR